MHRRIMFCISTLVVASSAFAAVKQFKPGWNLFSADQDMQLGKEMATKVEQQYEVVEDSNVQEYIDRIGKALAAQPLRRIRLPRKIRRCVPRLFPSL